MAAFSGRAQHRQSVINYLESHKQAGQVKSKSELANQKGQVRGHSSSTASTRSRTRNSTRVTLPSIVPASGPVHKKATIDSLPNEILSQIFWKLQIGELVQASQVCRRWRLVAADNLLWKRYYSQFAGPVEKEKDANVPVHQLEPGHWKHLCLKRCKVKRDLVYLKKWNKPDSYTGLKQRPELTLGKVGVRFELSFTDRQSLEHIIPHSDIYWLVTSNTVRWYDVFPDVKEIKCIRVYACSPLMFYAPTKPAMDGIVQKSLLLELKGSLADSLAKLEPLGSDQNVVLYELVPGLVVGLYQNGQEIAFVATFLPYHNLISRCLSGTVNRCWTPGEREGVEDDIDSQYGLHGYSCLLILRNMRQKQLECKFTDLCTKKHHLASGYASFHVVKKDDKMTHVVCMKETNFPWRTSLYKGIIKDVSVLDVMVLDERGEPFWTVSTAVAVKDTGHSNQLDFDSETYKSIRYQDNTGRVDMEIGMLDDGCQYLCHAVISLSVHAINKAFKTKY